jgi:hypothetical protein
MRVAGAASRTFAVHVQPAASFTLTGVGARGLRASVRVRAAPGVRFAGRTVVLYRRRFARPLERLGAGRLAAGARATSRPSRGPRRRR